MKLADIEAAGGRVAWAGGPLVPLSAYTAQGTAREAQVAGDALCEVARLVAVENPRRHRHVEVGVAGALVFGKGRGLGAAKRRWDLTRRRT